MTTRCLCQLVDRVVTERIDRERYPSSRVQEHRSLRSVAPNIERDAAGMPVRIYLP